MLIKEVSSTKNPAQAADMKWYLIAILAFLSSLSAGGSIGVYEYPANRQAQYLCGIVAGLLLLLAIWLVAYRPTQSMARVVFGVVLGAFVAIGVWLALLVVLRLGPWGHSAGMFAGLRYGVIGMPLGIVWGTWLCGQLRRANGVVYPPLIWARAAVALMTSIPLLIWLVGLITVPGPMRDPIAVSTMFALMLVTPGVAVFSLASWYLLSRKRPLLTKCLIAAVSSFAALVWASDFWLIGIFAGQKLFWLKLFSWPTIAFVLLTAFQWPQNSVGRTRQGKSEDDT